MARIARFQCGHKKCLLERRKRERETNKMEEQRNASMPRQGSQNLEQERPEGQKDEHSLLKGIYPQKKTCK